MICPHCHINIDCVTDVCPICHTPISTNDSNYLAYPQKQQKKLRFFTKKPSFDLIYAIVAFFLFIASIIINQFFGTQINWFWAVGVSFLYIYLLVRHTILSSMTVFAKVFVQAFMIFLLMWLAKHYVTILHPSVDAINWLFEYALPTILVASMLSINIATAITYKKDYSLVTGAILFAFLSFVPIILFAFNVIENWIYSTICAIFGLTSIVVPFIISPKKVLNEFKRKYHL